MLYIFPTQSPLANPVRIFSWFMNIPRLDVAKSMLKMFQWTSLVFPLTNLLEEIGLAHLICMRVECFIRAMARLS